MQKRKKMCKSTIVGNGLMTRTSEFRKYDFYKSTQSTVIWQTFTPAQIQFQAFEYTSDTVHSITP